MIFHAYTLSLKGSQAYSYNFYRRTFEQEGPFTALYLTTALEHAKAARNRFLETYRDLFLQAWENHDALDGPYEILKNFHEIELREEKKDSTEWLLVISRWRAEKSNEFKDWIKHDAIIDSIALRECQGFNGCNPQHLPSIDRYQHPLANADDIQIT